jgi:TPR repeat protein
VSTLVFYLVLGIATAGRQASTQTPQSQSSQQQSVNPELSAAEVSKLQAKAQEGDAVAQVNLGKAYEDGNGLSKNDELAAKWYRKAADQGNAVAQSRLGIMYRIGQE